MIIADVIVELRAWIASGRSAHEVINTFVDQAQSTEQQQILDELGDVNLSEPKPDLAKGWSRVRGQLAYNALYAAVINTPGLSTALARRRRSFFEKEEPDGE